MTPHPRDTDCPTAHCAGFDPDTLRADRYPGPPLDEVWQGALDGALAEVRRLNRRCSHPHCRTTVAEYAVECPHGLPFCEHCTWEDGCDECGEAA